MNSIFITTIPGGGPFSSWDRNTNMILCITVVKVYLGSGPTRKRDDRDLRQLHMAQHGGETPVEALHVLRR